jgi:uncharacterized protein (TIGR02145 family)
MKKLVYLFVAFGLFISCKKETTNNNSNNTSSVACIDNPNINFTSIGTPVGKFSDCIKDIDGNTYKTVIIGTQTWMAENLKTSKYNDGTSITNINEDNQWKNDTMGAYVTFNTAYNTKYGKSYNWYVVGKTNNSNKNVCPSGWHVPTDGEWTALIDYLGGSSVAGDKMKEVGITSWASPNMDATNISLFTGLPGGGTGPSYVGGSDLGVTGGWWSKTKNDEKQAYVIGIDSGSSKVYKNAININTGVSIRCVKD